jgi:flagellar hook-associated protein 1 FlgK
MANGMGSLWIGTSGLQSSQNALNITSNNIANVDTDGYVRQQVLFEDKKYISTGLTAAISKQTYGLGVSIADVIHNRDVFLDQSYRTETGRQNFYSVCYETSKEVENVFQELDGESFQEILSGDTSLWVAFQEFAKDPSSSVNQNLVLQKASLFITRSAAVYGDLKSYQSQLNTQIRDDIDRINELGKTIYDLNTQIQKIEAGGVETAMNLRDSRDMALDELASLVKIRYTEQANHIVTVSVEGAEFVSEAGVYEMGMSEDDITGFITPIWPQLNDENVFNLNAEISSEYNNDLGELKGLVIARGDHIANYTDMMGVTASEYATQIGMSVLMNSEAEFDNLVHSLTTSINDLLCPNTTTQSSTDGDNLKFLDADGNVLYTAARNSDGKYHLADAAGNTLYDDNQNAIIISADAKFLDVNTASTGSDGNLPPQELFTRNGCDRYTEITTKSGEKIYLYNEEDLNDTSKMYTTGSIKVNDAIKQDSSMIPYLRQNGEVNMPMAEDIATAWGTKTIALNPTQTGKLTFAEYYEQMIGEVGTNGSIYKNTTENLEGTVEEIDFRRDSVLAVSSDEELTNMIKYQNAYNAASRYFNVISDMLEYVIEQLG